MTNVIDRNDLQNTINALANDGELTQNDVNFLINYLIANGSMTGTPRDMIQIRRGLREALPQLGQGELAFTLDTKDFFVGGMEGNVNLLEETQSGIVNVKKKYGAIGDGVYHPLSDRFPTVATAQMKYPHATSLADSIDWAAIQGALNDAQSVWIPKGSYVTNKAIVMTKVRHSLRGNSKEDVIIKPTSDFTSTTRGSRTEKAMIWYDNEPNWVEGGEISGISLICNAAVDGIHLHGVANGAKIRDMYIERPIIGIHSSKNGWGNSFENLFIVGAVNRSMRLANFANGNTITNCYLYGKEWNTLTHLEVDNACFGNTMSGGYIEGCDVGIRIHNQAQLTVSGVDFEVCQLLFIESVGSYQGPVLQFPNPPAVITGCTFVGAPSQAGIVVNGGLMTVMGNNFILNAVDSGTIACLAGTEGGTIYSNGMEQPCISEYDNDFTSWKVKTSGKVFNRIAGINAGSSAVSKLLIGDRSKRLTPTQGWDAEITGKMRSNKMFGLAVPEFNNDTEVVHIKALGDRTYSVDPEDYTWNHYLWDTAALRFTANLQEEIAPFPTYGKAILTAAVTTTAGKVNDYGLVVNAITGAVEPYVTNADRLGSEQKRWKEIQTVDGVVLQDKQDGSYKRIVLNNGVLSAVPL